MTQTSKTAAVPRSRLGADYLRRLAAERVDPAQLTRQTASNALASVAYGGRFLPAPVFLSAAERQSLAADLLQIYRLLTALPERLFGGDVRAMARGVGMNEVQVETVERAFRSRQPLLPMARSDLYCGADGFKLLELNINSALGGFENSEIIRSMLTHPALARFVAERGLGYANTIRGIVRTMLAECAEFVPAGRRPVVALLDWPQSFATYEPRLKVMAALFDELGIDAHPCHVGQVEYRDGRLRFGRHEIDIVYRFFLVEEIETPADAELAEPVLKAFEDGRVGLFSRLDSELYGNKGALAMLSDDLNRPAFSEPEQTCIDRFLPWTRYVRRTGTDRDGKEVDLLEYAAANQQDLILKPTLLHGGSGVVPGWTVGAQQWRDQVAQACDGPYVLQERVRPLPEVFPADKGIGQQELYLNWGVFLADPEVVGQGGYNGCLVRGSLDPGVGVVSMSGGARVACSFHETDATA